MNDYAIAEQISSICKKDYKSYNTEKGFIGNSKLIDRLTIKILWDKKKRVIGVSLSKIEDQIVILTIQNLLLQLNALRHIALYDINLTDDFLKKICSFKNIKHLSLTKCNLYYLPDNISTLSHLDSLYLGMNHITELPLSFSNLSKLKVLALWSNKLMKFPESIFDLLKLERLYIQRNMFNELPDKFHGMIKLKIINISENTLKFLPKSLIKLRLPFIESIVADEKLSGGIFISDVKLLSMDISLFSQPLEVIQSFYSDSLIKINECKVVFLGDGETGKSSLIERIIENDFQEGKTSTDGIAIKNWNPFEEDSAGLIRIWDFGGQEIMHSMHKCFLTSRSAYVIVLNARENEFIDKKAVYWLDTVTAFAPDSPIIITINKMDLSENASLNENGLKNDYRNLLAVVKTSAKTGLNIHDLKESILRVVSTSAGYNQIFNRKWLVIKQALEKMDKPYLDNNLYCEICKNAGIFDEYMQEAMLKWFRDLGVSYFYKGISFQPSFEKYYVLNPNWLTNGIYRLILRTPSDNGFIGHEAIRKVLKTQYKSDIQPDKTYNDIEVEFILNVMRQFKLSYKTSLGLESFEFIPFKCPKDMPQKALDFDKTNSIHASWESTYIPNNAIYRLMIDLFNELDRECVWKYGARFYSADNNCSALAIMSVTEDCIDVYIDSSSNEAKDYLYHIRLVMQQILEDLNINREEYIHYRINKKSGKIKYRSLLNQFNKGKDSIYLEDIDEDIPPEDMFRLSLPQKQVAKIIKNRIIIEGDNFGNISQVVEGDVTI